MNEFAYILSLSKSYYLIKNSLKIFSIAQHSFARDEVKFSKLKFKDFSKLTIFDFY